MSTTTKKKSTLITYDINLDIQILNTILLPKDEKISITNLRTLIGVYSARLEEHLDQLVRWNIILDTKPTKNGKARIISFAREPSECMIEILKLKDCIEKINAYFQK